MASSDSSSSGSDYPSSSSSSKVSLKLLIDPKAERVVFAEASKDFIDFLYSLLCLPISTVTSVLTNNGIVGSLGKLHEIMKNLSDDYLNNPKQDKDILLKPPLVSSATPPNLYMCKRRCNYAVTYTMTRECSRCGGRMSCAVPFID